MARLHLALCEQGVGSSAVTRTAPVRVPEKLLRRFETWLTDSQPNVFSPLQGTFKTPISDLSGQMPDIVHLHWISRWLDLPSFTASLPKEIPIFITPHDFGIFTGGCHLHTGCEGFAHGCTHCPIVRHPFGNTIPLPARELARKRHSFEGRRITVVGNSKWTTSYARRSQAFHQDTRFETIHPAFEPTAFVRSDPMAARKRFNLSADLPVIGFGSAALSDENKRLPLFLKVAGEIAKKIPGLQILLFGDHHALPPAPQGTTLHHAGVLSNPADLATAYSAMDLFCVTSRIETFGQVSVEAQACGTPVAAFDAGGLSETLNPGITGILSPSGDIAHLAASVISLLEDTSKRSTMGEAAAQWVRTKFSVEDAAATYKQLYQEALAS